MKFREAVLQLMTSAGEDRIQPIEASSGNVEGLDRAAVSHHEVVALRPEAAALRLVMGAE